MVCEENQQKTRKFNVWPSLVISISSFIRTFILYCIIQKKMRRLATKSKGEWTLLTQSDKSADWINRLRNKVPHKIREVNLSKLREKTESTTSSGFEFDDFYERCKVKENGVGSTILYADMMESTQNIVQRTISDVPEGFLCVTDKQSKGRGRGSNEWSSPPGCLLFTFVTRFPSTMGTNLPFVSVVFIIIILSS